jgi:L-glyceraldehyde 3-phosphate reductase
MAIAWVLRDQRVTSALIGARTVQQLEDSLGALQQLNFSAQELQRIDDLGSAAGVDIWNASSSVREI